MPSEYPNGFSSDILFIKTSPSGKYLILFMFGRILTQPRRIIIACFYSRKSSVGSAEDADL